ncbi:amino acid permease [Saxibacter everestensis]|uniref:Amino acid permease n=1 Tax=Saxibacter everestensis TaxID=2909229 RepID=A0ABY8QWB5_9MICO|nr:amino acid permease [Brevibacteriaceae bacterium ZFBP1038]
MSIFRVKSIERSMEDTQEEGHKLRRSLGVFDLTIMGIAVAVGAGIFSVGATAAANYSGPSVILSFIIAGVVCGLAMMCYAEFASTVPVAGSAYTFSYATLGEFVAWIIGWDLILELLTASAVIAKFWGVYLGTTFDLFGLQIPVSVDLGPVTFEWPPVFIVTVFTILLVLGTKLSSRVNSVVTLIKVAIVVFIIIVGFFFVKAKNYTPFIPPAQPAEGEGDVWTQSLFSFLSGAEPTTYGVFGMLAGAALVFFAFIGFDVVATTAEETKNPQRTLPRGIFGGLAIVTVLYVGVTLVVTGMVSYKELAAVETPDLSTAFEIVGATWAAQIISIGSLIGLTTVLMVLLLGLSRVVFSMSRDGLLPRSLSKTSEKRGTPVRLQIIAGVIVAGIAGFTNVEALEEMINIGTLSAFVLVSIAVPILRKRRPDLKRGFTVPLNPFVPILSAVLCFYLMTNLSTLTWTRFAIWLAVGLIIYFSYGYRHSVARSEERAAART